MITLCAGCVTGWILCATVKVKMPLKGFGCISQPSLKKLHGFMKVDLLYEPLYAISYVGNLAGNNMPE
jgi:hypothetical protein